MSDYVKTTNFAVKDALTTGDPQKIVRGTEIDDEFNNIANAVTTKYDSADLATQAQAESGLNNNKLMTPLRVAQAIDAQASDTTSFTDLTDTPSTYIGSANKFVKVNATFNGLEFGEIDAIAVDGTADTWDMLAFNGASWVPTRNLKVLNVGEPNEVTTVDSSAAIRTLQCSTFVSYSVPEITFTSQSGVPNMVLETDGSCLFAGKETQDSNDEFGVEITPNGSMRITSDLTPQGKSIIIQRDLVGPVMEANYLTTKWFSLDRTSNGGAITDGTVPWIRWSLAAGLPIFLGESQPSGGVVLDDGATALRPIVSNGYSLGTNGLPWSGVYSSQPLTQVSDANLKRNVSPIGEEQAMALIQGLKPRQYQWVEDTRYHSEFMFGLVAQEVKAAAIDAGINPEQFYFYMEDTVEEDGVTNTYYGLRYTEFIAPMLRVVQGLIESRSQLEARVAESEAVVASARAQVTSLQSSVDFHVNRIEELETETDIMRTVMLQLVSQNIQQGIKLNDLEARIAALEATP